MQQIDPQSPLPCKIDGNRDTSSLFSICGGFAPTIANSLSALILRQLRCGCRAKWPSKDDRCRRPILLRDQALEDKRQECHANKFVCFRVEGQHIIHCILLSRHYFSQNESTIS